MKLISYSSILAVSDLERSINFYVNKLGFTLVSFFGNPRYTAEVKRDEAESITLLCIKSAIVSNNSIATLGFRCEGIDAIYEEFKNNEVKIIEEIGIKEYKMREFRLLDPDGYILYFQESIQTEDNIP